MAKIQFDFGLLSDPDEYRKQYKPVPTIEEFDPLNVNHDNKHYVLIKSRNVFQEDETVFIEREVELISDCIWCDRDCLIIGPEYGGVWPECGVAYYMNEVGTNEIQYDKSLEAGIYTVEYARVFDSWHDDWDEQVNLIKL